MSKPLISLAYYLPQFHEIAENNLWWGKGFTEWQQVRESKLYWPQQAIRKPVAPMGEYNLLDTQVMAAQQALATQHGINGFLVFDYWFGAGKTLLERPITQALAGDIAFDYALCWANHTWYNKRENITLQTQQYLGAQDYQAYFARLLPHFCSSHYIQVEGKPLFAIFNPHEVPDLEVFISTFNRLAKEADLKGIYWLAENTDAHSPHAHLFDRYIKSNVMFKARRKVNFWPYLKEKLARKYGFKNLGPFKYDYSKIMRAPVLNQVDHKTLPVVFSGWDTTPRHLKRGTVLTGLNIAAFETHLQAVAARLRAIDHAQPMVIIKSWNEWAEGNLMEPDSMFGDGFLQAFGRFVRQFNAPPHD